MRGGFLKKISLACLAAAAVFQLAQRSHAEQKPQLDAQHRQHILYGDSHGGGHLHGTGQACKSEFPANWRAKDIIAHVTADAANDNLDWKTASNGYAVADAMDNGVEIRIVVDRRRNLIITAYPLNTPRNPCPHGAANDNFR